MNNRSAYLENFSAIVHTVIKNDVRTFSQKYSKKQPKIEFLKSISRPLIILLNNLFPLSEQLYLINTLDKKVSVSHPTYVKFLNECLFDDFERYKINRLFATQTSKIKDLIISYPDQPDNQYKHLNFKNKSTTTFNDYKLFLDKYYSSKDDVLFEAKQIERYTTSEKILNFDSKEKYKTITHNADSFGSVLGNIEKNSVISPVSVKLKQEVSSGNLVKTNGFNVYESFKSRKELYNEKGFLKVKLLKGASLDSITELFEVVENHNNLPG
ncbi:hypothetical protein [Candidatus Sulfurimonas baltica]|uniref:Uncharacterized protein n=1 Tax=Candidatus Sulfurimonas baltica TaxID=2740404 RepID=A0A7S7LTR7_9BACT|nr:hypothetical protein [Candidatus Sulfurimonas baltica]QOY51140.1 hypothetical protein HUE88_08300 [Candidatus Sulfurimonas baltica]